MSEKIVVAEMVKEEGRDNVWRCLLCDSPPGTLPLRRDLAPVRPSRGEEAYAGER